MWVPETLRQPVEGVGTGLLAGLGKLIPHLCVSLSFLIYKMRVCTSFLLVLK